MAIHIFNCAIDAPDLTPIDAPEDLSYNDMETITELIAEEILGMDNFFEEHDDDDSDCSSILKGKVSVDFFALPEKYCLPLPLRCVEDQDYQTSLPRSNIFTHQYLGGPNVPPPWHS